MRITVNRFPSVGGATIGKLYINGEFACHTLEDEIRERPGEPVADWKIKGVTAIPSGTYRVTLEDSPRYGPDTITLLDVPGFTYIRMHAGNVAGDTEGCLLLGLAASERRLIGGTSRPAVALVKSRVKAAIERGDVVDIDINNPKALA